MGYVVQDIISNAILIIAVVIATAVVINAVYPAVFNTINSIRSTSASADSRSQTSITIVSCSFDPGNTLLRAWAKNSGGNNVTGGELNGTRAYYGNGSGGMTNYNMTYALQAPNDGDGNWNPGETVEFDVACPGGFNVDNGLHRVRFVFPGGATSEYTITT